MLSAAEEAETAGDSGLRYDSADEHSVLGWQTARSMAERCYRFDLALDDGSLHSVTFALK